MIDAPMESLSSPLRANIDRSMHGRRTRGMEWLLELGLVALLAATLFYALRLERALGVLKRDRVALEELATGFNTSTRAAEQGIDRLRLAADGAGRQIARQTEIATGLKEDLHFLIERGERLADRLDQLVRAARPLAQDAVPQHSYHAERRDVGSSGMVDPAGVPGETPLRVRSQAEQDLLRALRTAR
jgi:hypothetical protein